MKRWAVVLGVFAVLMLCAMPAAAQKAKNCTTIQQGVLVDSSGALLTTGYDDWGYNYQARLFNGKYCDAYRDAAWCQPYVEDNLQMKWNDAWLSNQDCDGDGKLDRHRGFPTYIGSGAWLTNHQSGTYEDDNGLQRWSYFVKMVAVPLNAVKVGGIWFTADGLELGPDIWGEFAILQEIYNDTGTGDHGVSYKAPVGPGLGKMK